MFHFYILESLNSQPPQLFLYQDGSTSILLGTIEVSKNSLEWNKERPDISQVSEETTGIIENKKVTMNSEL